MRPEHWTGVRWANKWTECREHLEDQSWARAVERSEEQEGIILFTDPVECDACEERDE